MTRPQPDGDFVDCGVSSFPLGAEHSIGHAFPYSGEVALYREKQAKIVAHFIFLSVVERAPRLRS